MDCKIEILEAELEWLYGEIADHQEYEERLQQKVKDLEQKLAQAEADVTCLMTTSRV